MAVGASELAVGSAVRAPARSRAIRWQEVLAFPKGAHVRRSLRTPVWRWRRFPTASSRARPSRGVDAVRLVAGRLCARRGSDGGAFAERSSASGPRHPVWLRLAKKRPATKRQAENRVGKMPQGTTVAAGECSGKPRPEGFWAQSSRERGSKTRRFDWVPRRLGARPQVGLQSKIRPLPRAAEWGADPSGCSGKSWCQCGWAVAIALSWHRESSGRQASSEFRSLERARPAPFDPDV
jgi:hypothetical protein